MLSPIILAALCALALLVVASVRRVPEGHVYTFRRMGGHVRIVGSGTHLVVPLVERVAHKISLAGAAVPVEDLRLADQRYRGVVYFQVLDPERADVVIEDVENLLRVVLSHCDAHCTIVQLRFSYDSAAARDGFRSPFQSRSMSAFASLR